MEQRKYIVILISIILMITCAGLSNPERAFGLNVEGNTPPVPIDHKFKPRLGTYNYKVEFNNLDIITASVVVGVDGDLYKMHVDAETTGALDKIFRMRYKGEAVTDTTPITPVETKTQQKVRAKEKDITISFQENGTIKTTEKKLKNGDTVSFDVRKLQTDRFTLDPFSASYLVRVLDWQVGRAQVFDVYTGKGQYELLLKCVSEMTIDFAGGKRKVWVIVPDAKELDDNNQYVEIERKKKPSNMKIYVSADEDKDILKMEASHTLGYFRVTMERFQPAEQNKEAAVPNKKTDIPIKESNTLEKSADTPVTEVVPLTKNVDAARAGY
jgi:hypothetical protein